MIIELAIAWPMHSNIEDQLMHYQSVKSI